MQLDLRLTHERLGFDPERHFWGKPCIRGHINENGETMRAHNGRACVLCKREIALKWMRDNPARAAANTKRRDVCRRKKGRRYIWPFATHCGGVAKRARDKGLDYNLTVDFVKELWIKQEGRCFWTGQTLDFQVGGHRDPLRPSLDRLIGAHGYIQGNVVWASNFANRARGDVSPERFRLILSAMGVDYHCPTITM